MNVSTDSTCVRYLIFIVILVRTITTPYGILFFAFTASYCITALMNELHKLRTDNQYLLGKIDATSVAALDILESQMADQKCINTSLQVTQ